MSKTWGTSAPPPPPPPNETLIVLERIVQQTFIRVILVCQSSTTGIIPSRRSQPLSWFSLTAPAPPWDAQPGKVTLHRGGKRTHLCFESRRTLGDQPDVPYDLQTPVVPWPLQHFAHVAFCAFSCAFRHSHLVDIDNKPPFCFVVRSRAHHPLRRYLSATYRPP